MCSRQAWVGGSVHERVGAPSACPDHHLQARSTWQRSLALCISNSLACLLPPPPAGPGEDGELPEALAAVAAGQLEPGDLPRCSAFLAAAAARLRGRPDVLRWEGQLPCEALPGLFDHEQREEEQLAQQAARGGASQAGAAAAGGGAPAAAASQGSQASQSVADRVRAALAARGGAGKRAGRKSALLRAAAG